MRNRWRSFMLTAVSAGLLAAVPAQASIVVGVQFVTAAPGSTGNALEVTLQNTGASPLAVGGFSFVISTSSTAISFTGANVSTLLPYIFAGDTLGGSINQIYTSPGQSMDGSDFALSSGGDSVAAGATVGIGNVLFNIAPGASSGALAVTLTAFPSTSLAGPASGGGLNIPIDTLNNGQITISGVSAAPEPASTLLLASALLALAGRRYASALPRR